MLIDVWAITFNLLSIAILGMLTATFFLSVIWLVFSAVILETSAYARKLALGLFVITPWFAGLFCLIILTPSFVQSNPSMWLDGFVHWHHLYVFNLGSWHGVMLLLSVVVASYVLVKQVAITIYHVHSLRSLTDLFHSENEGFRDLSDVVVIESQKPMAFTAGLFKPACYVTTGLADSVSKAELDIIIDHERVHIRHKDVWFKLLFSLFAAIYPKPLARTFSQHFSLAIEQIADACVCTKYNRFDVAQALVNAARLQLGTVKNSSSLIQASFVAHDVEVRVRELVAPSHKRSFSWLFCTSVLVATLMVSIYGVDGLHHFAESFFSH